MSPKQQAILTFIHDNDGQATGEELVGAFGYWYFRNAQKHLGTVLGRMIKTKLLDRVKRGVYALHVAKVDTETINLFGDLE